MMIMHWQMVIRLKSAHNNKMTLRRNKILQAAMKVLNGVSSGKPESYLARFGTFDWQSLPLEIQEVILQKVLYEDDQAMIASVSAPTCRVLIDSSIHQEN
jgi:hypothetical protein